MHDRMPTLTTAQCSNIHNASMNILSSIGVAFNETESLDIFKQNGLKVDGKIVFFSEKDVSRDSFCSIRSGFEDTNEPDPCL